MAKIHTHYDNLKVSRQAPQEVIRAAYKALSQKYHPDKNPGDEKAARIMAILNSAYETLSDPVRRKEHDDWIASEEWEVEWLESTHEEGERRTEAAQQSQWTAEPVRQPRRYSPMRDPRLWSAMVVVLAVGCVLGALAASRPRMLPVALASAIEPQPEMQVVPAATPVAARPEPAANPGALDEWASAQDAPDGLARTSMVRALGVTELVVPEQVPDCESDLYTLSAPNGEPWPLQTGYVDGYPVGNRGEGMQLVVDNAANASPVFVKVYDLDRRSNVRHVYIRGRESMTIEDLVPGKYEVRYQHVEIGSTPAECAGRRKAEALQQADASGALALPDPVR